MVSEPADKTKRNDPAPARFGSMNAVPRLPLVLGALGLLPFVFLSAGTLFAEDPLRTSLVLALATYGAIILSFLGGIQWGMAIQDGGAPNTGRHVLPLSVLPSLGGWAALLLLPHHTGLLVLAAGYLLVLAMDIRLSSKGHAPEWYPRLRWPLTLVVASCLAIGSL